MVYLNLLLHCELRNITIPLTLALNSECQNTLTNGIDIFRASILLYSTFFASCWMDSYTFHQNAEIVSYNVSKFDFLLKIAKSWMEKDFITGNPHLLNNLALYLHPISILSSSSSQANAMIFCYKIHHDV